MGLPGLPEQIRTARKRAGKSKAALARETGVDESLPTRWENGSRQPQLDNLERVAEVTKHRLLVALIPENAATVEITTTSEVARLAQAASGLSAKHLQILVDLANELRERSGGEQ